MQAVQSIEREKRMDGGKRKRRRTIPILLPQSRKGRSVSGRNCSLRSGLLALALCLYSILLPQARAAAGTALARVTGVSPLRGSLEAAYRSIIVS